MSGEKYNGLKKIIENLKSAIVAFSGGIDSTLVLKAAYDVLGNNVIAVTADSPSVPRREIKEAKKIAEEIGARHLLIKTEETQNEDYIKNPNNRCYFCKAELYSKLKLIAEKYKIKNILNGTNYDDLSDHRPGLIAADEFNVVSPLKEAKLTKDDVRAMAKHLGLRIWDKPSSPCLASRIPYGKEVTLKKLDMVEKAENFIKLNFGISELRVRHLGNKARIEINNNDFDVINKNIDIIEKKFNEIGFDKIELAEFRSGSLNLLLNVNRH